MTSSKPRPVPPPADGARSNAYARFIPREELSSFAAWSPGDLAGGPVPQANVQRGPTAPTGAADTLREDLESRGPVRISEVEGAQKELLKAVLQLAEDGQIMLGGGDDQFV